MRLAHPLLLLLSGCYTPSVLDLNPLASLATQDAFVETIAAGSVEGAATVEDYVILASLDGDLSVIDPLADGAQVLQSYGPAVRDAVPYGEGGALLATDEGLLVYQDFLSDSPLSDALDGPPLDLAWQGEDLWLRTPGGLSRWRDGALETVSWGDAPLNGPFAVGGLVSGQPVVWASGEAGLVALAEAGAGFTVAEAREGAAVDGLAIDATGQLFAAVDADLLTFTPAGWTRTTTPAPLVDVRASPDATGVWLLGGDRLVLLSAGDFTELERLPADVTLPEGALGVDDLGRLLLAGAEGLHRVGRGRSVGLVGLSPGSALEGATTVSLLPTDAETVSEVAVTVNGEALDVEALSVVLDPFSLLGREESELVATVTWADGETASTTRSFTVGALEGVTWTEHVEPLYQDNCARCHASSTETVLDGQEAWQAHIDDILTEVSAERMPLGGPPLTSAQIALIRSWRDGGFPE